MQTVAGRFKTLPDQEIREQLEIRGQQRIDYPAEEF
jgi:hypothetical protein